MKKGMALGICLFILVTAQHAQQPLKLFNGKDLSGWHTLPGGTWTVENGMICGRSASTESRHGLLVTDSRFSNFIMRVEYKITKGNSGLYFRVDEVKEDVGVHGFQAEIDAEKDAGGLYETGGRAWVVQPKPEDVKTWFKPGEWNLMEIAAVGGNITVRVNGKETATLINDRGRKEGHIALQLHGGMDMDVCFRNIEIKTL